MGVIIKKPKPYTKEDFVKELEWEQAVENAIIAWAVKTNGHPFTIEEVRFAHPHLIAPDGDERRWGAITTRVVDKGIIVHCGTQRVLSSRMGFKSLWRLKK